MHFDFSERTQDYITRVSDFMDKHVYPNVETYDRSMKRRKIAGPSRQSLRK